MSLTQSLHSVYVLRRGSTMMAAIPHVCPAYTAAYHATSWAVTAHLAHRLPFDTFHSLTLASTHPHACVKTGTTMTLRTRSRYAKHVIIHAQLAQTPPHVLLVIRRCTELPIYCSHLIVCAAVATTMWLTYKRVSHAHTLAKLAHSHQLIACHA